MTESQPLKDNKADNQLDSSEHLKTPEVPVTTNKELVLYHTFDASKELLFRMFTEPEHFKNWFGNQMTTISSCEMDVRIGGRLEINLTGPNGFTNTLDGKFYEIIENEKLVFTTCGFKNDANKSAIEFLNTVTFTDYNGKTRLRLQANVIKAEVSHPDMAVNGMLEGWPLSIESLESYIEKQKLK